MLIRASPFVIMMGWGAGGQVLQADLAQQTALAYKEE